MIEAVKDLKQFHNEMYRLELVKSSGALMLRQDLRNMRTWFLAAGAIITSVIGFVVYRAMAKRGVRLNFSLQALPV
jgi:hypothetical protein